MDKQHEQLVKKLQPFSLLKRRTLLKNVGWKLNRQQRGRRKNQKERHPTICSVRKSGRYLVMGAHLSIEASTLNSQYQTTLINLMQSKKQLTQKFSERIAKHITNRRDHRLRKREIGRMIEEWRWAVRWMTSSMPTFISGVVE